MERDDEMREEREREAEIEKKIWERERVRRRIKYNRKKCKTDPLIFTFFFHFSPLTFSFINSVLNFQFLSIQGSVTSTVTAAVKPTK